MSKAWLKTQAGREWKRKWEKDHYPEQREARRARAIRRRKNKRAYLLVDAARKRARDNNLAFDLDDHKEQMQSRIDAGHCELSGVPFNLDGGRTFDSPSIDRIRPSEGYLYSNIRVICDMMNKALSDYGEETLRKVMTAYLAKVESPDTLL